VHVSPDDVLIVAGTQQAMSLTARVLLDPGDTVGLEEPHYRSIRTVLQVHGARILTMPVDDDGLVTASLPQPAPKLVCVTPSHQFPTGGVLSLPRRMALLDYARRNRCWIFEDDYDGEFRYDSKPLAALRSLDEHNRVIYVGTFSKALFPALRLGYLVMPPQLRRDFIAAKWLDDFGSPAVEQAALAAFIGNGAFERHLRRTAQVLKERRTVLLNALRACSHGRLDVADSHAGMHLVVWLRGRSEDDCERLIRQAGTYGLGLFSIAPHYLHAADSPGLLMGYGGMPVAEIETAMALFAHALEDAFPLSAKRPARPAGRRRSRRVAGPDSRA
jgi:GntR family transcriptional regulator/MocR family aminotransferase